MASQRSEESRDYPTVLVVVDDAELRHALVRSLQQNGYFILEEYNAASALHILRIHSRPVHLMLLSKSISGGVLASALKQYRPETKVLLVAQRQDELLHDVVTPENVLARVREFFKRLGGKRQQNSP